MKTFVTCFLLFFCLNISDSYALKIFSWGYNFYGQLGNDTTIDVISPIQISGGKTWMSVSAGENHTAGIRTDGALYTWGYNIHGQLGDSSFVDKHKPVRIGKDSNWASISCGANFNLALKTDGTLWAWGLNNYRQLGNSKIVDIVMVPEKIDSSNDWAYIAAGYEHSLAIKKNGTLWAWGSNRYGKLGDGSISHFKNPVRIGTDSNWACVSAGYDHSIGIKKDGTLWAWGNNKYGQLGDGSFNDRYKPVQIGHDTDWAIISAGWHHNLVIKSNGYLWTWGRNDYGQLGDSTNKDRNNPVRLGKDSSWVSAAAGAYHSLAVKGDGSLWSCGDNDWNQLGDGSTSWRNFMMQVGTFMEYINVTAGSKHSTALTGYGFIYLVNNSIPSILCGGSTFYIHFVANWDEFSSVNSFFAELSDTNGSFSHFTQIGELKSKIGGSMKVTIPPLIPYSTKYRIRIVSSFSIGSKDNGYDITINPAPNPMFSDINNVCANDTVLFVAQAAPCYEYKWTVTNGNIIGSSNNNSCTVNWDKAGEGTIKLVVNSICGGSDSLIKNINIKLLPNAVINGKIKVCSSTENTFHIEPINGIKIKWTAINGKIIGRDDYTNVIVKWDTTGSFRLKLNLYDNYTSCQTTIYKNIYVESSPQKPVITRQERMLKSSSTVGNQWYLDSKLLKDSTQMTIYPSKTGKYQVQATKTGCQSEISDEFYFDITNVNEQVQSPVIKIYPNPIHNNFLNIEVNESYYYPIFYEIVSPLGYMLLKGELSHGLNKIDLDPFSPGMYYLAISSNSKKQFHKLIINK